ncbi:pyridoxal phosphate-dependent transferase [Cladochytrium replicatum]|nr:pyridoxal phosphate-dependent transferase [Cladochytrium replicatum]
MHKKLELQLSTSVESRADRGLLRALTLPEGMTDFSSNDYLGLARSSNAHQLFIDQLQQKAEPIFPKAEVDTSHLLGSTGSRLLNGNSRAALELESFLTRYHGGQSALLFNSGYDANLSLFSSVPQPGDIIVYDELIHASVHDGMRQSRARSHLSFKHNDVADAVKVVQNALSDRQGTASGDSPHPGFEPNIFVAVEAIYSMDGDICPLKKLVDALKVFGVYFIVDEAHATGVYGKGGRGLSCELGLENDVFARLYTFGKAIGSHGGRVTRCHLVSSSDVWHTAAILGSGILREYLINYARPLIYSTFLPFHTLLSVRIAYAILEREADVLQKRLQAIIESFRHKLDLPDTILLPSKTPIQGIIVPGNRQTTALANRLRSKGFDVRPIRSPTVPNGLERVRICLHCHNTQHEVDQLCREIMVGLADSANEMATPRL